MMETPQNRSTVILAAVGRIPLEVSYHKRPGLVRLAIVNFLLNIITLSIYRFWAKTRVRRHIWSSIRLNDEALEYVGTGGELFRGALIVFLLFILPIILLFTGLAFYLGPRHPLLASGQLVVFILFLLLTGMAIYRARRYRLSRTYWRGIRGALVGSSWKYSLLYFASLVLRILTLGWSTPAMNLELRQRMTREMRFGDTPFSFSGGAGPLYSVYSFCWFSVAVVSLLMVGLAGFKAYSLTAGQIEQVFSNLEPSGDDAGSGTLTPQQASVALKVAGVVLATAIGIYACAAVLWTFYRAREMSLFAAYTGFDGLAIRLEATTGSLLALWLGNIAILILTIGIGAPLTAQRNAKYVCDRLRLVGTVDLNRIVQSTAPVDRRGEGLADAFDIDAF
jgi:uncharacterized membrane protein YjgN (DUF898 family)